MKAPPPFLLSAAAFATAFLLGACGGGYVGGGSVEVGGGDYYGPRYGGPFYYGHPGYRDDYRVVGPPERHFSGRGNDRDEHHAESARPAPEHHEAPAPRPSGPPPGGGGHEPTTPEPRNQHP